jgi:hypothetical protein
LLTWKATTSKHGGLGENSESCASS